MNNNRVDGVEKYYKPAKVLAKLLSCTFYVLALLSLGTMLFSEYPRIYVFVKFIFFILTIFFSVCSIYFKCCLLYKSERARRKQLLSNAFGVKLIHDETQNYYNNEYSSSVYKLFSNVMENALFTTRIADKMLTWVRIKVLVYTMLFLSFLWFSGPNKEIVIWITQVLFSYEIIVQYINLEMLRHRSDSVYEGLHYFFYSSSSADFSDRNFAVGIDFVVEYEAIKSSAGILLSSRIFNKINHDVSEEWEKIRDDLKMKFDRE